MYKVLPVIFTYLAMDKPDKSMCVCENWSFSSPAFFLLHFSRRKGLDALLEGALGVQACALSVAVTASYNAVLSERKLFLSQ